MFGIKLPLAVLLILVLLSFSTVKTTTATNPITDHNTINNSINLQWKFVEAEGFTNFYADIPVEEHSDDPLTNPI